MVAVASHDERVSATPQVRAALSAPIEILFALYFLGKLGERHPDAPILLKDADPELAARARAFWVDAPGDFTELLVFAYRTGTLFEEDAGPFLATLEAAAASHFEMPDFPGEDPDDEATIHRHILELRSDGGLRQRYVALLREIWAVVEPVGRRNLSEGRRAVVELENRLANLPWREAVPDWAIAWCTMSEPYLDPAVEAGELFVVPMFISPQGKLIFSMPGMTVLAYVPKEKPGDNRTPRELAEGIAARHKVVADPTRLQLLGSLVRRGATVSELAALYDLAQPTVSVHMKQLREAGLVTSDREGAQVIYRTDYERLRELLGDAAKDLAPR